MSDAKDSSGGALNILLSALPTSVAASIQSEASAHRHTIQETKTQGPISGPLTPSYTTTSSSTYSSSASTSSTLNLISTTGAVLTFSPSATSPPLPANGATKASNKPLSSGAAAGLTAGILCAFVLLFAAVIFTLRWHQDGRFWKKHKYKKPDVTDERYPEVAWLYDPELAPASTFRDHTGKQPLNDDDYDEAAYLVARERLYSRPSIQACIRPPGRARSLYFDPDATNSRGSPDLFLPEDKPGDEIGSYLGITETFSYIGANQEPSHKTAGGESPLASASSSRPQARSPQSPSKSSLAQGKGKKGTKSASKTASGLGSPKKEVSWDPISQVVDRDFVRDVEEPSFLRNL